MAKGPKNTSRVNSATEAAEPLPTESSLTVPADTKAPATRPAAPPPVPRTKAPAPATRSSTSAPAVATDPLRAYLAEVRQFKLLTREEEDRLVALYKKKDDQEAAQKIITANLRLVVKIAMEFQSHWLNNLLDLIQEGNVGLMQALKKI